MATSREEWGAEETAGVGTGLTGLRLNIANLLDENQWSYGDLNYPRSLSLSTTVAF